MGSRCHTSHVLHRGGREHGQSAGFTEWTGHESCHDQQVRIEAQAQFQDPDEFGKWFVAEPPEGRERASASRSSSASGRKKPAASRSGTGQRSSSRSSNRSTASQNGTGNGGLVGTIKGAATKVSGPAVAVGATAVGFAGGLALKSHSRRKKILGIPVPRLSNVDIQAVAKSVGKASKQFGQTTKNVSKDIERVGDQAERIGKILG